MSGKRGDKRTSGRRQIDARPEAQAARLDSARFRSARDLPCILRYRALIPGEEVPMSLNPDQEQYRRNRLLAALQPRAYALLEPHLLIVPIGEGEFLHLPGDQIEQVY